MDATWIPTAPEVPSPGWLTSDGASIPLLLIHVWASWNGHDRAFDTYLQTYLSNLPGPPPEARSLNVDNLQFWSALRTWGVLNVPALVIIQNGTHRGTLTGVLSPDQIAERVSRHASA